MQVPWIAPNAPGARREPLVLLLVLAAVLVWSGVAAADWRDWLLEISPVIIGVPVLVWTYRGFPMTPLAYRLAFVLAVLLSIGAHFMFSRVPAGYWLERTLHLSRNPFDRIVHFTSGFAAAVLGRELLRRRTKLSDRWIFTIVAAGCLGGAALYELLEWAAAVFNVDARAFVSTQGDRWDTQWDMLTTFAGALVSLVGMARVHDRQLRLFDRRALIRLARPDEGAGAVSGTRGGKAG
ncbi:MAG TPA: DUF2238 domain-containing protein [Thermoanaerobaculia bacterium]